MIMPPPAQFHKFRFLQLSLVSSLFLATFTISGVSFATSIKGIIVDDNNKWIDINDSELKIGQGDGSFNYPITFKGNGELTINFTEEAGTVFIDSLNPIMTDGGVNTQNSSEGNLVITNGSLDVNLSGDVYRNQGAITLAFGGNLSVDKDLKINYSAFISDTLSSDHPYVGLLAADTTINVGGSVDISLNTRLGMESIGPSVLVGIWNDLRSDALEDSAKTWNFGSDGGTLRVHDVIASSSTNVTEAYGIRIDSCNTHVLVHDAAIIENIHSFTKSTNHSAYAVGVEISGGQFDFLGSVQIKNISAQSSTSQSDQPWANLPSGTSQFVDEAYALAAFNGGTINVNHLNNTQAVVQIENDMIVADGGAINANFLNEASHFIGTVSNYVNEQPSSTAGTTNLVFQSGAFWRLTANNNQTVDLTLNNAQVFLNQSVNGQESVLTDSNGLTLSLETLSGENGLFHLRTSLEEAYGDSITIKTASGEHRLALSSSGTNPSDSAIRRTLVLQENGDAVFSLANSGGVIDLGNYVYSLTSTQTENGTEWHLSDQTPYEPAPDTPALSPSATAVLALAGSGSQTTQFLYSLSDLRERMGDVRHNAADGLYVSIRGGKDRLSGFSSTSFKNEYGAVSLGYDRKLSNNWIIGMSFEAIEGDQTLRHHGYRADGEDSTQSLKGYATWFNDTGYYTDFVVGFNRFDQDISTHMLDGSKVKGDYDSYGFGVSMEAGRKFEIGTDSTWFIEPQVQLAYFRVQGEDFTLNNGMSICQEDADSLTGRLGIVAGKTLLDHDGTGYQISTKIGINHEFLDDSSIHVNGERFTGDTLGTRGYYGVGFDWYLGQNMRVYGQLEREEGSHYTSEINARVGLKYQF